MPLTVFLLKASQVADFEKEIVVPAKGALPLSAPWDGVFIPLPSSARPPSWVEAIKTILNPPATVNLSAQSAGGILVVRRNNNTFVLTFGHAWQRLEDRWLERDYGGQTALNAIPRDNLVEIKAEQVFAKWHLASERAPRASSVDEFGVEFDRDLVAAVEGVR